MHRGKFSLLIACNKFPLHTLHTVESIRFFNAIGKGDVSIAGGKGASLGEMTQAGIPVPEGFVVLASAFERFLDEAHLRAEIDAALDAVCTDQMHTIERAAERIQSQIVAALMPADIAGEITKECKKLGAEKVAVRSSATAEDGASAAWAGQLDTFLNTEEQDVLKNVQRCWASLFTPRAIFYRFEQGLQRTPISVAVVIQTMVQSEAAGVAFSVHPVTEDPNQLIVEAARGLGDKVVSGQVTPDSYVVEKESQKIIDVAVRQQSRVLTDEQIRELATLVIQIEKYYGFPCDIEWAFEKGKFYITQSRPITTLRNDVSIEEVSNAKNPFGSMAQWQRLFRVQGLRFFIDDLWMDHYKTLGALTLIHNDEFTSYLPHSVVERTLAEGRQRISDAQEFEQYETDFRTYMKEFLTRVAVLDFHTSSKDDVKQVLNEIARLFFFYSKTEFFATDGAYKLFEETKDGGLEQRLERMGKLKNDGRTFLNSILFGADAVVSKLLQTFEQRFEISQQTLRQYSRTEILALFDNVHVDDAEIERRNVAFYMWGKGEGVVIKTGAEAKKDIEVFVSEMAREHSEMIQGTSAHKGKARGTARVTTYSFDNFDAVHQFMERMQNGEILVAETTSPELMTACQKAAGIITDQGGMLSHAAIVSRELNIPCIVGTSNATEIIKDGDLVEIDGATGMVHILERARH